MHIRAFVRIMTIVVEMAIIYEQNRDRPSVTSVLPTWHCQDRGDVGKRVTVRRIQYHQAHVTAMMGCDVILNECFLAEYHPCLKRSDRDSFEWQLESHFVIYNT